MPSATTRTETPVVFSKIGRMYPNKPEFSVDVVDARVIDSAAFTVMHTAPNTSGATQRVRKPDATGVLL